MRGRNTKPNARTEKELSLSLERSKDFMENNLDGRRLKSKRWKTNKKMNSGGEGFYLESEWSKGF